MSSGLPPDPGSSEPTREQMALLVDLSRKINSRLDLGTILHKVVEYSLELTRAERGFLFMSEGADHLKVVVAMDERKQNLVSENIRVSSGVVSAMLAHGIPIFLEDVRLNDMFARRQSIAEAGVQFIMGIPLKVKGRVLGFIYVDNTRSARRFLRRDRQILTSFADQAALAMENARLRRERSEVERDVTLGRMSERLLATIQEGVSRIDECLGALSTVGSDESTREDLERKLRGTSRMLARRLAECREIKEFVNDDIAIRLEPVVLDQVVKATLDGFADVLEEKGIRLHVSLNIGRSTMADGSRIRRVLDSIVTNAVEALEGAEDPFIAVTTAPVPEGVLIEVRDNGRGVAGDDLPRLFEPFFTAGKRGGLGLGLSLARRVVKLHRGHMEIKSTPDHGTSVWVVLPADLRQSLVPRARRSSAPPPSRHP